MAVLATKLRVWRIGDRDFPRYSAFGATQIGARWNSPGVGLIYAAGSLEGAMLEVRVHTNGLPPPRRHGSIWIDLPKGLSYERIGPRTLKGWRGSEAVSRAFDDEWMRSGRSCVLFVPSAVVPGVYRNVLINPAHPEAARIAHQARPSPLRWDRDYSKRGHNRAMSQTLHLPQIADGATGRGRWMTVIFDNDHNSMDEVVAVLMRATHCDEEEAAIEMWEAHTYGKAPVHFASKEECQRAAGVIERAGIRTEVAPEWDD